MNQGTCPRCAKHTKLARVIASDEPSRTVCEDRKRAFWLAIASDVGVGVVEAILHWWEEEEGGTEGMMTLDDAYDIPQHEPGAKLDKGKVQAAQLLSQFPRALSAVIEVAQFGANKYTLGGWQEVPEGVQRYQNAEMRHKLARWQGQVYDPESGLPHMYHEAWNVLAVLELALREAEEC